MNIFTPDDRERIKNDIINYANNHSDVSALMIVGSGAVGYTDNFSDLDFCVVVNRKDNIINVMNYIRNNITDTIYFKQMEERGLQVFVLNNYLEIDIGYTTLNDVNATREQWKILFDKTDTVQETMESTWELHKKSHSIDCNMYIEAADVIWHLLFLSAVAIKRKNYWRAIRKMNDVRNMVIELKGSRYMLDTSHFRDFDKFPPNELIKLEKTLTRELSQFELFENLENLIDVAYDELELQLHNDIEVNHHHVKQYIANIIKS